MTTKTTIREMVVADRRRIIGALGEIFSNGGWKDELDFVEIENALRGDSISPHRVFGQVAATYEEIAELSEVPVNGVAWHIQEESAQVRFFIEARAPHDDGRPGLYFLMHPTGDGA